MPAWPDAAVIRDVLARLWRRRLTLAAIDGATIGCLGVAVFGTALWIAGQALSTGTLIALASIIAAATIAGLVFAASRRSALAADVERQAPTCQNLVVTATELLEKPEGVEPSIGALVCQHAARRLSALDAKAVFPVGRPALRVAGAAIMAIAVVGVARARPLGRTNSAGPAGNVAAPAAIAHVTITIHPPSYSGLPDRTVKDPADLEALTGSALHVVAETAATAVTLETIDGPQALAASGDGFAGDVTVTHDGYLALQASAPSTGPRRFIGLVADIDHPPLVHVTQPGKDLFVPDDHRHIPITIQAEDDLGLASLKLAYTKVTGSGEDFTFGEGEVPVALSKTDDRHWSATADWDLSALKLAPGDMVVYRGVATDHRPGATAVDSDAFIVQVLTPNQAALGGFSIDDDPNKYALSQRMVILKTERLLAKKPSMPAADYLDEAMGIAAEERQVRAMFIFMLGGEFEDASVGDQLNETAEAESEGDVAAGRLHNQARVDLGLATRMMSSASTSLAVPDVSSALSSEKSALDAIQRAFTKDRYLLRALSSFERIDLTRRLGGTLTNVARGTRPAAAPEPPAATTALRKLLARLATAASATGSARTSTLTALADDCVRADPSSPALRDVASMLTQASTNATNSQDSLDKATTALAAIIRASSPDAPAASSPGLDRLNGALADALKSAHAGGSR